MIKQIVLLVAIFSLVGCVTKTTQSQQELADNASFESREELLVSTNNSEKLIEFYRESLRNRESTEIRVKLVSAYVDMKDYDSAAFHVEQITPDKAQLASISFLKAKIYFAKGSVDDALVYADQALKSQPEMAETENLLGLIWAEKGDYQKSRNYFLLARKHFFDDVIIKNNLAVLDLIEGNYMDVVGRLYPIYEKGNEDPQVLSNLALAYAKLDMYKPLEVVLKDQGYTKEQAQQIYVTLRLMESDLNQDDLSHLNAVDSTDLQGKAIPTNTQAIAAKLVEEAEQ
ncbi:secretion protein [Vibrio hannami]|uniref:tetratricopeptide repeat protein n=1 Tax=Vibrio hannami TaxID=2717094 RepID=UPI0024103E89|nr:tetratricopeptide repeat protein [Vibrio hannami]MDG3085987.1 secretion protein [Vibrio hannami]